MLGMATQAHELWQLGTDEAAGVAGVLGWWDEDAGMDYRL